VRRGTARPGRSKTPSDLIGTTIEENNQLKARMPTEPKKPPMDELWDYIVK
jgi:hypothetical protein